MDAQKLLKAYLDYIEVEKSFAQNARKLRTLFEFFFKNDGYRCLTVLPRQPLPIFVCVWRGPRRLPANRSKNLLRPIISSL